MLFQSIFLTCFAIAFSVPLTEEIKPVKLNYQCVHVHVEGEGKGEDKSPILLLHAVGLSHIHWDGIKQVLALFTKRRVCAVDLRNHGDSPWSDQTDIPTLEADVLNFVKEQKMTKVIIVGHCLGGKVAMRLALNNPDMVESLVIEDMVPNKVPKEGMLYLQGLTEFLKNTILSVSSDDDEDTATTTIANRLNEKLKEMGSSDRVSGDNNEVKAIGIRSVDGKWQYKWNINLYAEVLKDDKYYSRDSGSYTGPALFIYGINSPFKVNDHEEAIKELFPKAKFRAIEGAGHVIHRIHRECDDAMVKFINGVN